MAEAPLRLLQAIAGGAHGGAEAFFVRLAIAFHRAGVDQRLLVRRDLPWVETLRAAGLKPRELAFGGALDLSTGAAVRREIADFAPNVVLTWMNRATRFSARRRRAGPRYVHVARLGGYYDLKYYQACDHLIGNTEDIVRYLCENGWPAPRAHYVPNFVDDPPASARRATEPGHARLIVALGRLHRNKAFDVLLAALPAIPGAHLWLAGEGPEREALQAQARALGIADRVEFLGWREDVETLYGAADVMACPSRIEPLGNVVIEGWAHRVPVVAAAAEGPAALITANETGLLVPREDPAALGMALRTVLETPALAARLAEAGRAAFEASYTEGAVVAEYLALFERLRGGAARPSP